MQETGSTCWAETGIYIVQRRINKRCSRSKGGYSPYEVFYGKKKGNCPADILGKDVLEQCLTEDGLQAALDFVNEEHAMEDKLSPNFNDRILAVIQEADASAMAREGYAGEEESMKPAAVEACAMMAVGGTEAEGPMKLEAKAVDAVAMAGEVLETVAVRTSNEGDEEPVILDLLPATKEESTNVKSSEDKHITSTPTKASIHHESDTPERGVIRAAVAAAQRKQAIAVNKKRRCSTYVEELRVGDVCTIQVEGNTRAATDHPNLPVMITKCKQPKSNSGIRSYQVASRDGHLKGWYPRENLDFMPNWNADIAGIDIDRKDSGVL